MKNAIILHGMPGKTEYYNPSRPSASNAHWLPWLQKQLMIAGIKADTPEIPNVYQPDWEVFVREVERFDITPQTCLVGHSLGAGFWVRYLSQHPDIIVDKVVLVAPWLNPNHEINSNFFDFEIDPSLIGRVKQLVIFESDNDQAGVCVSVKTIKAKLPAATIRTFSGYGHFTEKSMGTIAFLELLDVLLASD